MSLLLEALKKAALEKQNRADPPPEPVSPPEKSEVAQTLSQEDNVAPVVDDSLISDATGAVTEETNWDDIEDLDFEDELEDLQTEPENLEFENAEDEVLDFEEQEAARQLDEQRKLLQQQEEELRIQHEKEQAQFDKEQQEAARREEEREDQLREQALKEQELRDKQFEEQARREAEQREHEEQQQQLEQAREQEAISAQRDRQALDQLIASGKAIARKSRRRSVFLYAMLVMTAAGGILSYYFYLSANSSIAELQQPAPAEPVIDIAEIIESSEVEPAEVLEPAESLDETIESTQLSSDNDEVSGVIKSPVATEAAQTPTKTIAERIAPPPSAPAHLRPLITSDEGGQQGESIAERVIIHHKPDSNELNDLLKDAYNAHKGAQYERASLLYSKALALDPSQRDALLGAAATATALGAYSEATTLYQRQLNANPADSYARAGMLGLMNSGESRGAVQREIQSLLAQNPDSAQLHFLRGVGFASSQKWRMAQSAFYEAYRIDNQSPDYAFNLAVSLDHLAQRPLASVYYKRALSLAEDHAANFNRSAAQKRLLELSQESNNEQ